MATVEHKNLPDSERHEPKGISIAVPNSTYVANGSGSGVWTEPEPKGAAIATVNTVYVADGAGSGTWKSFQEGWGYYQHSGTAQVFTTTPTKLLINGSGALSNSDFLPKEIRGVSELWNTSTNKITPIRYGDGYDLRIELPITAKSSATELTLSMDVGGGATPTVVVLARYQSLAKTPPFTLSIAFPIVALTALTVTNGIQLFINTDSGSCDITNPSILIKRDFDGAY